jgi:hypothetical protein
MRRAPVAGTPDPSYISRRLVWRPDGEVDAVDALEVAIAKVDSQPGDARRVTDRDAHVIDGEVEIGRLRLGRERRTKEGDRGEDDTGIHDGVLVGGASLYVVPEHGFQPPRAREQALCIAPPAVRV